MALVARPALSVRAWDLGVAVVLALAAGPGRLVDQASHQSLVVHMGVQHWLLVAAGALGARALADRVCGMRSARFLGSAAVAAFLVWHIPGLFGWAVADPALHGVMHLTYLGVGAAAAWALSVLPPFERVLLVLGAMSLMGPLSLAMVAGVLRYPGYRPTEAQEAGVAMLAAMQLAWFGVALGPPLAKVWRRSLVLRSVVLAGLVLVVAVGLVA